MFISLYACWHLIKSMGTEKEQITKIRGFLTPDRLVVVKTDKNISFLVDKGYGILQDGHLYLYPTEALYLVYKEILEVYDDKSSIIPFKKLLEIFGKEDSDIWIKLNLYTNLRKRGFIVRKGIGGKISFFVDKKSKDKVKRYLVEGVVEGVRIGFRELENLFRRSVESGRELVIAVIDKEGNISYYIVNKLSSVESYGEKVSNIH
ncbi:MAG: hypothetical protein DRJ64_02045 [Thermoprotei archaeon]|nr:MAG: hypothetical protein DRJ64_02045 [Thermoprotei archaeon]